MVVLLLGAGGNSLSIIASWLFVAVPSIFLLSSEFIVRSSSYSCYQLTAALEEAAGGVVLHSCYHTSARAAALLVGTTTS